MPNWCSNTLTLSHEDPAEITRAADAFRRGDLFNEFVPLPKDQEENWYDWHISNWGTKWDVGGDGYDVDISDDGRVMTVNFDSAWSPPIFATLPPGNPWKNTPRTAGCAVFTGSGFTKSYSSPS